MKIGPKDQLETEAVSLVNNFFEILTTWLERTDYYSVWEITK